MPHHLGQQRLLVGPWLPASNWPGLLGLARRVQQVFMEVVLREIHEISRRKILIVMTTSGAGRRSMDSETKGGSPLWLMRGSTRGLEAMGCRMGEWGERCQERG